jgi:hypothetical protein
MAGKKAFPLRLDPELYDVIRRWADDELRSVNAQIEFLLSRAARDAGRRPRPGRESSGSADEEPGGTGGSGAR